MKTNTFITVVAVTAVVAGGFLMWAGDTHRSTTFQPPPSAPNALPSSTSSSPLPSPAALPQSTQIEVGSDMREEPLEPEVNPISEKPPSSDLATQLSMVTQPQGPADVCVEMTKTVLCPIIGQMPFVRDWAGQFAIWGKTSCPMGDPAT